MPTSPRSRDGRLRTARGWRPPFALNTEQAHVMHVRLAAWKSCSRSGRSRRRCGYEDLNDHDVLRDDALLGVLAGKRDPTGVGAAGAVEEVADRGRNRPREIGIGARERVSIVICRGCEPA